MYIAIRKVFTTIKRVFLATREILSSWKNLLRDFFIVWKEMHNLRNRVIIAKRIKFKLYIAIRKVFTTIKRVFLATRATIKRFFLATIEILSSWKNLLKGKNKKWLILNKFFYSLKRNVQLKKPSYNS